MKTVALSVLASSVVAWIVVVAAAPEPVSPPGFALDLEDRLGSLDERLRRLQQGAASPGPADPALATVAPDVALRRLRERVAKLEQQLEARGERGAGAPRDEEVARERARPERRKRTARPLVKDAGAVLARAQEARDEGHIERARALLRKLLGLRPDQALSPEEVYQIGWARRNAGDPAGARDAWLLSKDFFAADHYRHAYARLYAAESALQLRNDATAEREVLDLIDDLERDLGSSRAHILEQGKRLLLRIRG